MKEIFTVIYENLTFFQSLILLITAVVLLVHAVIFAKQLTLQKNTLKTETFKKFAEREADIYKDLANKDIDPEQTRDYEKWYLKDKKRYLNYNFFARYCWNLVENIFQEKRWTKELMKRFAPMFEILYSHHGKWFQNNYSYYEMSGLADFVKTAGWRNYLLPEEADLLRWNSETYNYHEVIFSPLHPGMFPFFFQLTKKQIVLHKPKTIIDLGCGNGKLGIALVKEFKSLEKIYMIDFSDTMIAYTKRRCEVEIKDKKLKEKIEIKRMKIQDMSEFETGKFDMVFSVNAILPRNPKELKQIFGEISRVTKIGGYFVALLPSYDTVIEFKNLRYMDLEKRYKNAGYKDYKKRAKRDIKERFYKKGKLDEKKKTYADDFRNPQRFFGDSEIKPLLNKYKFKLETLGGKPIHFEYPWEFCKKFKVNSDYTYGYFPDLPPKVYDLFIVAKRLP